MTTYELSSQISLRVAFINQFTGAYVDPTAITFYLLDPTGKENSFGWPGPNIIRDSLGHFHTTLAPIIAGTWKYKWQGSGAVVATSADNSFNINSSTFGVLTVNASSTTITADTTKITADTF